ncbi:LAME_0E01090g1_1 [Lachancea meyersii CBS 8951]|uniref:LAME_0E01090g1_1 n=1 Tax=Lachancea meyersii CBS 8951 TaxID=1266667 RepID=A0A1G4JFD6_9SACH|nr:LAME_0E01090g1_1 [Lachancea meyersii CBS 8951]
MIISRAANSKFRALSLIRCYRKRVKSQISHVNQVKDRQNDLFKPQEVKMRAESPDSVEKKLKKLGFKSLEESGSSEELFVDYLNSSPSPFKKSRSELDKLKKSGAENQNDASNRMELLFDFMLEESEREIKRLDSMGPVQMQKLQNQHIEAQRGFEGDRRNINSEKELERAIFKDLEQASNAQDSERSLLPNTERMFRVLSDLNMRKLASAGIISPDQMVGAFEASKVIPLRNIRLRGVLLAGHLIYSLGRVRMDPVNESFYIEALVYYGFYKKALELFNSNRRKVNQRWWYEMGMMICLRANHLAQFDRLLQLTMDSFGSDYVAPRILRTAIRKKLYIRDYVGSGTLTDLFTKMTATYGWRPSKIESRDNSKSLYFTNEVQADQFLNQKEQPTELDYVALIQYHFFRKRKDEALMLLLKLAMLPDMDKELLASVMWKLKIHLLQSFDVLKNELQASFSTETDFPISLLQEAFKTAQLQSGIHELPQQHKHILFDNISAVALHPSLVKHVEDLADELLKGLDKFESKGSGREYSLKIQNVLKALLKNDKEVPALELLNKVEKPLEDEENHSTQFTKANAHHYAVFVDYYSAKAQNTKVANDIISYENKIERLVTNVNEKGIKYNAMLLSSLLQHYRKTGNLDNCFNIINTILNYKANPETDDRFGHLLSFFERREITKPLYLEIWKCFALYYSYFDNGLGVTELRSNHGAWTRNVSKERAKINVHPACDYRTLFKTMVLEDNILPDTYFYQLIIKALVRVRDWSYIPALLKYMSDVNGIEPDEKSLRFINGGLRLEYIAIEREMLISDKEEIHKCLTSLMNRARRIVENQIKAGTILKESHDNDKQQILENILDFLKEYRSDELIKVNLALEELDLN